MTSICSTTTPSGAPVLSIARLLSSVMPIEHTPHDTAAAAKLAGAMALSLATVVLAVLAVRGTPASKRETSAGLGSASSPTTSSSRSW